jgi:hypothetical protein
MNANKPRPPGLTLADGGGRHMIEVVKANKPPNPG